MSLSPLSDTLALYILNQRAILDALSIWAKGQNNRPLDQQLWDMLKKHASAIHFEHSLDHTQTLLEDFRLHSSQQTSKLKRHCGQVLEDALQHLLRTHFEWRHYTPLIRYDRVLQVQAWLAECNPDPLQCYLWAVDCIQEESTSSTRVSFATSLRQLPLELLKVLIHGPTLPGVGNPVVQQLRAEGLTEIHRHLNGNALPNLLWAYLVLPPYRLVPKELAGNVDGLEGCDCIALIRTARDLRSALIRRLLRRHTQDWNKDVLERLQYPYETLPVYFRDRDTFQLSGLPDYRDPAALLLFGEDEPLIGERAFLYHAFRLFHESTDDALLAAALHAYLLIQNLIWRALIQPRIKSKGFDRFDRYHSLFLRRPEKDLRLSRVRESYFHRLIQAQRTGGVRWIELRTTPFDGVLQESRRLEQALHRILEKDIADRQRELKRVLSESQDGNLPTAWLAAPGQRDYQLNQILQEIRANTLQAGLIFHFIKQADTLKAREQDDIIPCRHSRLRCLVWKQAIEIRRIRRSRRYGQYIVGLDAANSELKARPEVFAPAIRWLREVPCLPADPAYESLIRRFDPNEPNHYGLTFHVGEDFRHLLSGLRAVDEALRFLDMGPGDRIGHGLALGIDYKSWCERVSGEVAMPCGERLDDLVWLRERLSKEPGRFGRLLFAIDDKIRRLAWELYSPLIKELESKEWNSQRHTDWELLQLALVDWQHLYEAWTWRGRDPLRYGDPTAWLAMGPFQETPPHHQVAQLLWRHYHFNPGVRARYEVPMRVSLIDYDLERWHEAITWVQDELLGTIRDKRIAIEINPTSNLCIAPLQNMKEHPVFRWHPPEETNAAIRPYILVGSDDPGVFGTELAFEYAALSRAAEERGAAPREIERWLRELRDNSKMFCFLNTAQGTASHGR
ncbi:MAG: hypothetical protein U1F76_01645 [Candidatus Competibacteraceae bacterium]